MDGEDLGRGHHKFKTEAPEQEKEGNGNWIFDLEGCLTHGKGEKFGSKLSQGTAHHSWWSGSVEVSNLILNEVGKSHLDYCVLCDKDLTQVNPDNFRTKKGRYSIPLGKESQG